MSQRLPAKKADYVQLPLVLIPNTVVFPYVVTPLYLSKESSEFGSCEKQKIFVATSETKEGELLGTVCQILRRKETANNKVKFILQGIETARIVKKHKSEGFPLVDVNRIMNRSLENQKINFDDPLCQSIIKSLESLKNFGKIFSAQLNFCLDSQEIPVDFDRIIVNHLNIALDEKKLLLHIESFKKRLHTINDFLCRELEFYGENQRLFCQTQIVLKSLAQSNREIIGSKVNKDESTKVSSEYSFLEKLPLEKETKKVLLQQYAKLSTLASDGGEYNSLLSYFDQLRRVPWHKKTLERHTLKEVEKTLSKRHIGLEDVKERILEHLSLKQLNKNNKGVVLCLVGPPGVGKTSIGESIASALGRPFVRISLGGVKEEADIRGHRRTYVGSYPGRIMSALQTAGVNDPVVMLDEIDKMPDSHKSGAAGALLEVLDPQQNKNFVDHYLNVPFDLSKVMFIANANSIDNLNPQLKDRLEVISVYGYTEKEKTMIARKCLLPKILKESGLDQLKFTYEKGFFSYLIQSYTRESGVRSLERVLRKISRKIARSFVANDCKPTQKVSLTKKRAQKFLGNPIWQEKIFFSEEEHGMALALAYSPSGGALIVIESKVLQGSGLTLTGNMGSVMKESIQAAFAYLRVNASLFGIDPESFHNKEVHIHMPEGACYKEGPSAGLPILCSLVSAFLQKPLSPKLAMTGEITLGGKILCIGGLKEKVLAASREGMHEIILPSSNSHEYKALSKELQSAVKVHFVECVDEVFAIVFPKIFCSAKIGSS